MQKDKDNKDNIEIDDEVIVIDNNEIDIIDKNNDNDDLTFNIDLNNTRATSGTISKNFHNGGYYLKITWEVTSQSKANNTSTVKVNAILGSNGSAYYISSSASKNITLTINGTKYSGTCTVGISANGSKTLMTKTVTVSHKSDGTKTCSFACSLGIAVTLSGTYYSTVSVDGEGTFNKINLNTAPTIKAITQPSENQYIAENTSSTTVKWNAAEDTDGNLEGYQINRYVNGSLQSSTTLGKVTSWTDSGLSSFGQGATIQYGLKAKDSGGLWSSETKSKTLTKNKLTGATLASSANITNSTPTFDLTWSGAKNTNSNTAFKYDITCNNGVTVYNATNLTNAKATIKVLSSGSDTGPYILKSQIINAFKSASYKGTLTFTLKTKNNYGSSATSTKGVSVDLRTNPTAATVQFDSTNSTCYKTVGSTGYYIPDGSKKIRVKWSGGADKLGGSISYKVEYKLGDGSYTTATSSTTSTTHDLVLPKQTASQKLTVKVTTITSYSYSSSNTNSVTLHYYNSPSIDVGTVNRSDSEASVTIKTKLNTSISTTFKTRKYSGASSGNITTDSQTIKATGLSGDKTYTWTISVEDNTGLGSAVTKSVNIPVNVPIFSIREKGVAVNCIPNAYMFEVNGKARVNGVGTLRDGLRVEAPDNSYSRTVIKPYSSNANGLNLIIESGANLVLGSGESATTYLTDVVGTANTSENLYLTSDSSITLASNCNVNTENGITIDNRKEVTIKDGLMTINTKSASASSGLKIKGSDTAGALYCGSAGFVIKSDGEYNLHLGRNNYTDMVFYSDKIQVKKAMDITGNTTVTGTFKATGTSTLAAVNGTNIAASGTLKATGATTLSSTLTVNGASTLKGDVTMQGGLSVNENIHSGYSINVGAYEEKFRAVNCRRKLGASSNTAGKEVNYEARYGVSHRDVKLTSDSSAATVYGAVIEAYNATNSGVARSFMFSSSGVFPTGDNNSYLGSSSHRWKSAYCTEGKFYTSTKSFKTNIKSVDVPLQELTVFSNEKNQKNIKSPKEYIIEAIKDTPMTIYNYKTRMHNNERSVDITENPMFIGFIADDLKANHPEFFELIGECGIQEKEILDKNCEPTGETYQEMQYDISDISMLGALWTGLQEALIQIDNLKQEIKELKEENKNV